MTIKRFADLRLYRFDAKVTPVHPAYPALPPSQARKHTENMWIRFSLSHDKRSAVLTTVTQWNVPPKWSIRSSNKEREKHAGICRPPACDPGDRTSLTTSESWSHSLKGWIQVWIPYPSSQPITFLNLSFQSWENEARDPWPPSKFSGVQIKHGYKRVF